MSKKQEPAFQWYPSDWRTSPAFLCSIAARGLWREMIDMMHNAERPGYLSIAGQPIPDEEIARFCGLNLSDYKSLLAELFAHQVPRWTSNGVIFSHRMVADFKKRKDYRKWKSNQRDREKKEDKNPDVRVLVRPMSGPSSSSSSDQKKKPKPTPAASPPVPDWIHEPTWFAFVKMRKKIRAELTDHAIELTFKDLEMLKNQGHDPKAVLEQSIKQGWRGVFELRTVRGHGGTQTPEERMQQNLRNSGLDSEGNYIPRRVV